MSDTNPVVGQDFELNMVTTEDLVGATVTLNYIKPDGVCVEDITPTNVDTGTKTITYIIPAANADVVGAWRFKAEIISSAGWLSKSNPSTTITYDADIC